MLRNLWTYWKKPGNGLRQTKSLAAELYHGVLNIPVDCRRAIDICRGIEDFNFPGTYHLLKLPPRRPDILHCHNLHGGYFDLRALPCLSAEVPTVLTLHDAWLLSGHCAHSFDCDLWKTGCDKCPDLTIYPPIQRDAAAYNWRRKREIYARSRLYVATASRWLMSKIEQSILSQAIVESRVIPNGAELDIFHPADKRAVRAELKMPQDAKIILSVANKIKKNMFKDFHTMQTAISTVAEQFPGQNILLFAVGDSAPPERIGKVEVSFIPFLEDRKMIARFYQAADVYIHTARVETFGNTVMEALACGTPVVATGVGGIPEQVEDNVSGFLVPPAHPEMMAARIQQLLSDDELRLKMGGMRPNQLVCALI